VALGQVFSEKTSVSTANLHSICFSTIIFSITRGWHNMPGVAAVPIASQIKKIVVGFSPRRPGFKPGSYHVGFCDGQKWRWGRFSPPRTSVSPANLYSICFSTIIFTITRVWHNMPGVAAVPIASQSRIKKKTKSCVGTVTCLEFRDE
jgi:hypothetical protein